MPEPATLQEETAQQIERLAPVDFVVGVASLDHAETIAGVLQAARTGLERAFPGARVAVLHADGGSRDGTVERARAALGEGPLIQLGPGGDAALLLAGTEPAARAAALHAIFSTAVALGARGCALLDAELTSAPPEWVGLLLAPVAAEQADFVGPYYARHRFEGAITTSIVYPLVRALYGKRLRYPLGGDCACSTRLIQRYLAADVWRSDAARSGIDVWLTVQALTGDCRVTQAALGTKTQTAGRGADLSTTLSRALGALCQEAERTVPVWQKVRRSEPVPVVGPRTRPEGVPAPLDPLPLLESFRLGERTLQEIWGPVLPPLTLLELRKLARSPDSSFRFADELWARIVYDFVLAYRMRLMNRDHLLSAFTPLYAGWLAGFAREVEQATESEVEERIERLCLRYEAEKPYLISRWRWPDRFSP